MITFGYKSKFSSILRAFSAIAIGIVMLFSNNATVTVVKVIAAFLVAAGLVSIIHGIVKKANGELSLMSINAIVDIVIGVLLFFFPTQVANFIVYLFGIILIIFGALQLIVLISASSLVGMGIFMFCLSAVAILGGIFLLFNPLGLAAMTVIAGCCLIIYGINELISAWKVAKAEAAFEAKFNPAPAQSPAADSGKVDTSNISQAKEVDYQKIDEQ